MLGQLRRIGESELAGQSLVLAVLTVILFIVAVAGFFDWRRRYKLQKV